MMVIAQCGLRPTDSVGSSGFNRFFWCLQCSSVIVPDIWLRLCEMKTVVLKSKMKWAALLGLVLSISSLVSHLFLARYTGRYLFEHRSQMTIFTWRPIFETSDVLHTNAKYMRLWGPVKSLGSLLPLANPRGTYKAPGLKHNGFVFVKIRGGFHEIRNAISDIVAISRLLNAALVIPELQSTTSSKGVSSGFKSFNYLYDEDHFIAALAKDVMVVKTLPKQLKFAKKNNDIPVFTVRFSTSSDFYLKSVLPMLKRHKVVEILVPDGGCLQALLPPTFEEYQRLRCRVAFHALRFRREVQDLGTKIVHRLQSSGRRFIAFGPGLTKDALAYHGCAEQFQDVHTELIQHKRKWMIKHGVFKGNLSVDSVQQHLNVTCPLMPEEIGIVLRAFGYPQDTIIYVAEGELFGGQRLMISLHSMFDNVVDRTSLTTVEELTAIYGHEDLSDSWSHPLPPVVSEEMRTAAWKKSGPRPRPLPPPPSRLKYLYNAEGWWHWVSQSEREPQPTTMELRTQAHKLLWDAIDYIVSIKADAFIPGFDRDGMGHGNFASLVMGHRLYLNAATKTFRPDRKTITLLLEEGRNHLYKANRTWITSVRKQLMESVIKGLTEAAANSKPLSFLSHPVPECLCTRRSSHISLISSSNATKSHDTITLGVEYRCPEGMNDSKAAHFESYEEEDLEESDDISSNFFSKPEGQQMQWKQI